MINIAIAGATGYGGIELVRWLSGHPEAELAYLSSESYAGQKLHEVYPHLPELDLTLQAWDPVAVAQVAELIFLALPHGKAMECVPTLLAAGKRVIDLSGDFRLKDPTAYPLWYGMEHTCPHLLAESVYVIPELARERLTGARLVCAPGCYPTGALLALAPLLKHRLVDPASIIVDSKSGVSGAGRTSLKLAFHFPEANEGVSAYKVAGHQHTPEIEQEAALLAGNSVVITFTPHLIPMTRGIFTTAYARLISPLSTEQAVTCFTEFYRDEPFVKTLAADALPHTKATWGSNQAHLTARVDERTGRVIVLSAIDNLGKGQAGQAVQIMNALLGLPETTGLDRPAVYP